MASPKFGPPDQAAVPEVDAAQAVDASIDASFSALTALQDCDADELREAAQAIGELTSGHSKSWFPVPADADTEELRQSLIETVEHMDLKTLERVADRLKNMGFHEVDKNSS
jgi:hypothetical protein